MTNRTNLYALHSGGTYLPTTLPLLWPTSPDLPPSPKKSYRSLYVHLGWAELEDPAFWAYCSEFDLLLRPVDFAPLRPLLAHLLGWTSAQGQTPFDPVSLCLFTGWQITQNKNRSQALRDLRDPRNSDYARLFGFQPGDYPSEGGLRHFLTALGQNPSSEELAQANGEKIAIHRLNRLLAQSVQLLWEAGFLSPSASDQALLCPDGMLHQAASHPHCYATTDTCYLSSSPQALSGQGKGAPWL